MALTMYAAPGVGLAAPQVGVLKRMVVIDTSAGEETGKLLTLINPEITYREGLIREEEGCLSFPDIVEIVERPAIVSCRALDLKGKEIVIERAEGLLARAVFHEIDHLDGVLLVDRVNAFRRTVIKKKIRRKVKAGEWTSEAAGAPAAAAL
jgi:peptide deformylase